MESFELVLEYFNRYGMWFLFFIVFLEYLNLPGLPTGIIMPAAGVFIWKSDIKILYALFISVAGGLLGSLVLYTIGYFIGRPVIEWLNQSFPSVRKQIIKLFYFFKFYGDKSILIARVIPVARTLISIVAGIFNVNIAKFLVYSAIGISIWNSIFILAGYIAARIFLQ